MLVVISLIAVILAIMGGMVVLRNHSDIVNRRFSYASLLMALWLEINFFANDTHINTHLILWANRLTFVAGGLTILLIFNFIASLIGRSVNTKRWYWIKVLFFIILIMGLTPYMVTRVTLKDNIYVNNFGILAYLYFLLLLIMFLGIVWVLFKGHQRLTLEKKSQVGIIFFTLLVSGTGALITSAIMPFFGNYSLSGIGSLFLVFWVFSMAYAIVRHKMFDIRLIIARSLVYSLSILSIGFIFFIGSFILVGLIADNISFSSLELKLLYTSISIIIAFSFQTLRKFFDRITNKLFYRDAYDVQIFLDQFTKIIVSNFELTPLLKKVNNIVEANLKPTYSLFGLKEDDTRPRRLIGSKNHPVFEEVEISYVRSVTPSMKRKIIVTDLLEDKYFELQRILRLKNIAIIARLATSLNEEGIGYLILGPKKSGNMYNGQDIKVLEIVANELVVAIQNALHTEEIENFNRTLQYKVIYATRRLRRSNEKLKALDEAKDDFVSMASHQLRTPLTSVKGNISLVLDGDAGNITDLQRQLLNQAFTSSQRMVYLIADLLNVSRLKTGKFVIERAPVNLADIIEDEVRQLIDTASSRHLTLTYNKPEGITVLMLDDTKTRQVIMNFVDNAIYYTPAGGKIDVVLTETEQSVECRVIDNGIGVPSNERPHLFMKFYRAANARKARPDGTGLGLYMAKKVIVSEGGALIFESEEGKGSTFGFSFPKAKLAVDSYVSEDNVVQQAPIATR